MASLAGHAFQTKTQGMEAAEGLSICPPQSGLQGPGKCTPVCPGVLEAFTEVRPSVGGVGRSCWRSRGIQSCPLFLMAPALLQPRNPTGCTPLPKCKAPEKRVEE